MQTSASVDTERLWACMSIKIVAINKRYDCSIPLADYVHVVLAGKLNDDNTA